MNDFVLIIVSSVLVVPLAYFAGYWLRSVIPQNRRFTMGFIIALIILTIALVLSLEFHTIRLIQSVATAIAIGFPLGIAGPPFNHSKNDLQGKK